MRESLQALKLKNGSAAVDAFAFGGAEAQRDEVERHVGQHFISIEASQLDMGSTYYRLKKLLREWWLSP